MCTDRDLPHEAVIRKLGSTRLQHLAVDYELDSGKRHRALFDALLCCEIAAKHDDGKGNLERIAKRLREPKYVVYAWYGGKPDFSDANFNKHKEYLKRAGFRWDGNRWSKINIAESQIEKHIALASASQGWKTDHQPYNREG